MPTKRVSSGPLTVEELSERARWGGLLPGVPELTDEQRDQWRARTRDWWVPMRALRFCWDRVDAVHGDAWSYEGFEVAVARDRAEIAQVVADHPEQGSRLQRWLGDIQRFALEREREPDHGVGYFYTALSQLGYLGMDE